MIAPNPKQRCRQHGCEADSHAEEHCIEDGAARVVAEQSAADRLRLDDPSAEEVEQRGDHALRAGRGREERADDRRWRVDGRLPQVVVAAHTGRPRRPLQEEAEARARQDGRDQELNKDDAGVAHEHPSF